MTQFPPPGWYEDPTVQATLRYWDGQTWTDGPPPSTPQERRDTSQATALMVVAFGLAGLFGLWSMFAMMVPADACTPENCNNTLVGIAYAAAWLGLPIAVIGGLVGVGVAVKRRRPRTVPAVGSVVAVVVLIIVWFVLMRLGTPATMW